MIVTMTMMLMWIWKMEKSESRDVWEGATYDMLSLCAADPLVARRAIAFKLVAS
jgi:hypothetical protein